MPFNKAYKHLGNLRRAGGGDAAAWEGEPTLGLKGLRGKFAAALERLRKVRKGSMSKAEFCMVSDALLGGLAGFHLQTLYLPYEMLDKVEAQWRQIYNAKYGRDRSQPVVELYEPGVEGHRPHIWAVGLAAVVACMERAMSDVHDTEARAAAQSAVARALVSWGCRQDPNWWDAVHVAEALERKLRTSVARDLGERRGCSASRCVNCSAESVMDSAAGRHERTRMTNSAVCGGKRWGDGSSQSIHHWSQRRKAVSFCAQSVSKAHETRTRR